MRALLLLALTAAACAGDVVAERRSPGAVDVGGPAAAAEAEKVSAVRRLQVNGASRGAFDDVDSLTDGGQPEAVGQLDDVAGRLQAAEDVAAGRRLQAIEDVAGRRMTHNDPIETVMRLFGGPTLSSGRLEVFPAAKGKWGTVCTRPASTRVILRAHS